ncbi:MAG: redox-sensitive transcriptional activator SoxR [Gammaproteobacteria bacterium]
MNKPVNYLSIGEAARRSGVATSTLRFYESRGLIQAIRVSGNHRRYHRAMLRRISIIRIAQTLGLSLREISNALESLPNKRTPTNRDWEKLSTTWGKQLDQRIANLQNLRDRLSGCIGCGCLSLKRCSLYNAGDLAGSLGAGPRYLLGDEPSGN